MVNISRRGFLKGLAGLAAGEAVGLSGCGKGPIVDALVTRVVYDKVVSSGEKEINTTSQGPVEKKYRVILRKCNDSDGNGVISQGETSGYIKHNSTIDIKKHGVLVNVFPESPATYSIFNSDGKILYKLNSDKGIRLPLGMETNGDRILINVKTNNYRKPLSAELKIVKN